MIVVSQLILNNEIIGEQAIEVNFRLSLEKAIKISANAVLSQLELKLSGNIVDVFNDKNILEGISKEINKEGFFLIPIAEKLELVIFKVLSPKKIVLPEELPAPYLDLDIKPRKKAKKRQATTELKRESKKQIRGIPGLNNIKDLTPSSSEAKTRYLITIYKTGRKKEIIERFQSATLTQATQYINNNKKKFMLEKEKLNDKTLWEYHNRTKDTTKKRRIELLDRIKIQEYFYNKNTKRWNRIL